MKKNKEVVNLINHFTFRVEWSEEDEVFIAQALEMPSIKAHGNSPEKALVEVKVPLEIALEAMVEDHESLPEPIATQKYKGSMMIRTTPEKHKEIAMRAAEAHVSINQYILSKLG